MSSFTPTFTFASHWDLSVFSTFFFFCQLDRRTVLSQFNLHSVLTTSELRQLFTYLLVICVSTIVISCLFLLFNVFWLIWNNNFGIINNNLSVIYVANIVFKYATAFQTFPCLYTHLTQSIVILSSRHTVICLQTLLTYFTFFYFVLLYCILLCFILHGFPSILIPNFISYSLPPVSTLAYQCTMKQFYILFCPWFLDFVLWLGSLTSPS